MTSFPPETKNIQDHLLGEMERSLGLLAARWRTRQRMPEAGEIARQYGAILRCMIELGYRESLDVDSELPDELLPQEYLSLFETSSTTRPTA